VFIIYYWGDKTKDSKPGRTGSTYGSIVSDYRLDDRGSISGRCKGFSL